VEDFATKEINNIRIEVVNLTRATYKEASELKKILSNDNKLKIPKLIVDISQCEFIDSTFLGVLVVSLKDMWEIGGEIRLVKPCFIANDLLARVGTLKIFNTYDTLQEAVDSFT